MSCVLRDLMYCIYRRIYMHQTDRIKIILERINDGTATDKDVVEFNQWYASFDDSKVTLHSDNSAEEVRLRIWNKIDRKINSGNSTKINWRMRYSIAAAAAILVLAGVFLTRTNIPAEQVNHLSASLTIGDEQKNIAMNNDQFLDSNYYYSIASADTNTIAINTTKGALTKLILPDGTKVTLNASSKLYLESGFDIDNSKSRIVRLEGEGYFEVTTVPNKQFVVKTKDQVIRVLGTKFNVKSLANSETQTTLYEGKVHLEVGAENLIMHPNEIVSNSNSKLQIIAKDIEQTKDWRSLKFSFDQDLIENVIYLLADRYNLKVSLQSTIPQQKISGLLGKDLTLSEIAQVMSNLTGGDITINNNTLTVNFNTIN